MFVISKLLGLWVIGRTVSSTTPLFMRLLLGMAAITVLAILATILTGVLIVGALWFIYFQLVTYGVDPAMAVTTLGGLILALVALTLIFARNYWIRVRRISQRISYMQAPIAGRFSTIADAFVDGFFTPVPRRE